MKIMQKVKKQICILLTLAIAISGMYFEPLQAHSSFRCFESADFPVISHVSAVVEQNKDFCTRELLGKTRSQNNIINRISCKRKNHSEKQV